MEVLFEKFNIIECLKKDSAVSVYLADHIYLGKKIILKTLNMDTFDDKSILSRFKREARILAGLDHQHIIKVLDFGTYNQCFYISFEFFESKNLRKTIKDNKLTHEEKKRILIQILNGIMYSHEKGVIHRDLKPENILADSLLNVKIADFGLAVLQNDNTITNQYTIVGTPGYMSPEQIRGEILTNRSDLFSIGIVALELYSGKNPFIGKDINETINNILASEEIAIDENIIPEDISKVIKKLLKQNPEDRYVDSASVLTDLGESVVSVQNTVSKYPVREKKSRYILYFIIFLIAAALVTFYFTIQKNEKVLTEPRITDRDTNTKAIVSNIQQMDSSKENEIIDLVKNKPEIVNEIIDIQKEAEVAPPQKTETGITKKKIGKLFIECLPWAVVYIDSQKIDTTPLQNAILLPEGEYLLMLVHPEFPAYSTKIKIQGERTTTFRYNLEDIMGYLECKIYPWGEIYINGQFKSQSPMIKPLRLLPGKYELTIKNPSYLDYKQKILIKKNDTLTIKLNYETFGNK